VVDEPAVRRDLLTRFPYALYYRWDQGRDQVAFYPLCSRPVSIRPGLAT